MAQHGHSAACCSVPPVISKGYEPKGEYVTIDGLKTYKTGPPSSKRALLIIYDIFGYYPQILQGADILANSDKEQQYQVFMPDFFEGKPADISWYPPDNDEKGRKLGEFFKTTANPQKAVERVPQVVKAIEEKYSGIESWGIVGFCWGGKIVNLSSQKGTLFKAAAACHPAMVDPSDAPGVSIPYAMLPSKDEDKSAVEEWQSKVTTKNIVKWFPDQVHGFMAARGDLEKESVKNDYVKAYQILLEFFHENM